MSTAANDPAPWPRRLAFWTFLASIPLVLFGGTVTTLRAGLAENGWLAPDGYFLWLYPLDMRVRDLGTFVEHHHREFGSLVGLLAVALVVSTWITAPARMQPRARSLALAALVSISLQGAIGGFRVLERNPDLAFLHGALAHAVFAFLAGVALSFSERWRRLGTTAPGLLGPRRLGVAACALVYVQIVLGAWFRHSQLGLALSLHVMLALGVVGVVTGLARGVGAAAGSANPEGPGESEGAAAEARGVLRSAGRRLSALVWSQIALGLAATAMIYQVSGGPEGAVSAGEAVFATLHVAVGALLLAQCLAATLWTRRLSTSEAMLAPESASALRIGGAQSGGLELGRAGGTR